MVTQKQKHAENIHDCGLDLPSGFPRNPAPSLRQPASQRSLFWCRAGLYHIRAALHCFTKITGLTVTLITLPDNELKECSTALTVHVWVEESAFRNSEEGLHIWCHLCISKTQLESESWLQLSWVEWPFGGIGENCQKIKEYTYISGQKLLCCNPSTSSSHCYPKHWAGAGLRK